MIYDEDELRPGETQLDRIEAKVDAIRDRLQAVHELLEVERREGGKE